MNTATISSPEDPYEALVRAARNKLINVESLHHHPYMVKMILPSFDLILECSVEAYTPIISIYSELRRVAISSSSSLLHLSPEQRRQLLGGALSFHVVTPYSNRRLSAEATFGQLFKHETTIELYLLTNEELLHWPKKRIDDISPSKQSCANAPPLVTVYSPAFLKQTRNLSTIPPLPSISASISVPSEHQEPELQKSSSSFDIQMTPIHVAPILRSESSSTWKPPTLAKSPATDIHLVSTGTTMTRKEALSIQEIQRLTRALQDEKKSSQRLEEKVQVLERQRAEIETMLIDLRMTTEALKSIEKKMPSEAPAAIPKEKGGIFSRKKTSAPPPPPQIAFESAPLPPPPPPPVLSPTKSLSEMLKEKSSARDQAAVAIITEPKQDEEKESKPSSFLEELQKRQALKKDSGTGFLDPELSKQNRPVSAGSVGGGRSIIDEIRERNSQKATDGSKTPFIDPIEARKAEKARALQEAIDMRSGLRKTGSPIAAAPPVSETAALFASPIFRKRQAIVEESVSKREQELQSKESSMPKQESAMQIEQEPVMQKEPIMTLHKEPVMQKEEIHVMQKQEPMTLHKEPVMQKEPIMTLHKEEQAPDTTTNEIRLQPFRADEPPVVQLDHSLDMGGSILPEPIKSERASPIVSNEKSMTVGSINVTSVIYEPDHSPVSKGNIEVKTLDRAKRKELSEIAKKNIAAALESIDKEEAQREVTEQVVQVQPVAIVPVPLMAPHPEPGISYFDDIDDIDVTISIMEPEVQRADTPQEPEQVINAVPIEQVVNAVPIEQVVNATPVEQVSPPPSSQPSPPSQPKQAPNVNRAKGVEKVAGARRPSSHRTRRKK